MSNNKIELEVTTYELGIILDALDDFSKNKHIYSAGRRNAANAMYLWFENEGTVLNAKLDDLVNGLGQAY